VLGLSNFDIEFIERPANSLNGQYFVAFSSDVSWNSLNRERIVNDYLQNLAWLHLFQFLSRLDIWVRADFSLNIQHFVD